MAREQRTHIFRLTGIATDNNTGNPDEKLKGYFDLKLAKIDKGTETPSEVQVRQWARLRALRKQLTAFAEPCGPGIFAVAPLPEMRGLVTKSSMRHTDGPVAWAVKTQLVSACPSLTEAVRRLSEGTGLALLRCVGILPKEGDSNKGSDEASQPAGNWAASIHNNMCSIAKDYNIVLPPRSTSTIDQAETNAWLPYEIALPDEPVTVARKTKANPMPMPGCSHWVIWAVSIEMDNGTSIVDKPPATRNYKLTAVYSDSAWAKPQTPKLKSSAPHFAEALSRLLSLVPVSTAKVTFEVDVRCADWSGHVDAEDCGTHAIVNATSMMNGETQARDVPNGVDCLRLRHVFATVISESVRLAAYKELIKESDVVGEESRTTSSGSPATPRSPSPSLAISRRLWTVFTMLLGCLPPAINVVIRLGNSFRGREIAFDQPSSDTPHHQQHHARDVALRWLVALGHRHTEVSTLFIKFESSMWASQQWIGMDGGWTQTTAARVLVHLEQVAHLPTSHRPRPIERQIRFQAQEEAPDAQTVRGPEGQRFRGSEGPAQVRLNDHWIIPVKLDLDRAPATLCSKKARVKTMLGYSYWAAWAVVIEMLHKGTPINGSDDEARTLPPPQQHNATQEEPLASSDDKAGDSSRPRQHRRPGQPQAHQKRPRHHAVEGNDWIDAQRSSPLRCESFIAWTLKQFGEFHGQEIEFVEDEWRLGGEEIQRFRGSKVQRFRGSEVQRFRESETDRCAFSSRKLVL
ncbi:uncharacterized protein B0I36DRAFT_350646 [Microdochium trichocladiopsis]|uniref:Uncharacterized protein n=1 Tax=Microdochium trichocladiopsis TaxID=1682393 RepID=A0A9P8Y5S6_9PEZI|nr:uncharacterized protein B0I36DRAFT_350646 [Microdochium trichocladiopsis]KAH7029840.1 hypothetical protein B0I36DRAFT_350646 [Microdochium trichocladiopsis]